MADAPLWLAEEIETVAPLDGQVQALVLRRSRVQRLPESVVAAARLCDRVLPIEAHQVRIVEATRCAPRVAVSCLAAAQQAGLIVPVEQVLSEVANEQSHGERAADGFSEPICRLASARFENLPADTLWRMNEDSRVQAVEEGADIDALRVASLIACQPHHRLSGVAERAADMAPQDALGDWLNCLFPADGILTVAPDYQALSLPALMLRSAVRPRWAGAAMHRGRALIRHLTSLAVAPLHTVRRECTVQRLMAAAALDEEKPSQLSWKDDELMDARGQLVERIPALRDWLAETQRIQDPPN